MSEVKLKKCPFCGDVARIVYRKEHNVFDIGCSNFECFGYTCTDPNCECGDGYTVKELAIEAWNKRVKER